jgi:hypothetical protein
VKFQCEEVRELGEMMTWNDFASRWLLEEMSNGSSKECLRLLQEFWGPVRVLYLYGGNLDAVVGSWKSRSS